jgi:hypothetical protein
MSRWHGRLTRGGRGPPPQLPLIGPQADAAAAGGRSLMALIRNDTQNVDIQLCQSFRRVCLLGAP